MRRLLALVVAVGLLAALTLPAAATPNGSILPPTVNSNLTSH